MNSLAVATAVLACLAMVMMLERYRNRMGPFESAFIAPLLALCGGIMLLRLNAGPSDSDGVAVIIQVAIMAGLAIWLRRLRRAKPTP